jgi:predicted DNA-binding transcriptional regulator YafY
MSDDDLAIDEAGELSITATDDSALVSAVLFAGDGVEVISPTDLRDEIIAGLESIRDAHAEARS